MIDTPIKRYSSGMHVRLGFSVAAHLDPDILLVDEVLAVGDAAFQKKCLGKMEDVAGEGRTVLFVSHNMESIANLCSRAILLNDGRIVAQGDTGEVISSYILSNEGGEGEVYWADIDEAPGNENVRLKAVRIRSNDRVTNDVPIDNEVTIEIDYLNLKEDIELNTSIRLKDKMNSYVLASGNRPSANLIEDPWAEKKRPKGIYRTTCVIPANFLNSEYYAIDVAIVDERDIRQVWEETVISFVVHETGEMRAEYGGGWVGVVRPKLAWSTELVSE